MARRGMMTALQAALAGVAGGIEGRVQQQAREEERNRVAAALDRQSRMDTAAAERQSMLDQIALGDKGFVERGVREERAKQAAPAIGSMVSTALSSMGVGGGPVGVLPDLSAVQKAAGTYGSAPAQSFTVGGKTYDQMQTLQERTAMETAREEESKARQMQQAEAAKSAEARRVTDAKKADMDIAEASWVAAGLPKAKAKVAAMTGAKYGDVMMSDKDMQTLGINRAQLKLAQDKFDFDKGKGEGETQQGQIMSGLQAMGKARAVTALNLLETNSQIMSQFEKDLAEGKVKMTGIQLEAARKALAGTTGSALAEEALNKGNFLVEKNPALLRYIRAGKGIASGVREITPRGGSNLMMQMEIALSGIGPGGTDPASLAQVGAFRNDLVTGVRSGVEAMTGKPSEGASNKEVAAPSKTLEQEFPGREAQIKAARGQGYSDADIRAFLGRGR